MTRTLLASCAVAALLPVAAAADEGPARIVIEQVQLGAQSAWLDVHVPAGTDHVAAGTTAVSNAAASILSHGVSNFEADQRSEAGAHAATRLAGGRVTATVATATTAYGNSAISTTGNGNSQYAARQVMNGQTTAGTAISLAGASEVESSTVAAANVSVSGSVSGDNRAFQTQEANGSVSAFTEADICCIATSASFNTSASGNVASSTGSTSTSYNGAVQTTGFDGVAITASSDVYSASASNVTGAATASGNSYVLQNEWGFATLGRQGSELFQGNGAAVSASSAVELDHWSGTAASIAYGVGNTAHISNIGSDTSLNAIQSNFASVDASASLAGQSWTGGTGHVAATAAGNVASAVLCNMCGDGVLSGNVSQYNQGNITASAQVNAPMSGHIAATASAIGNTATFVSSGH